MIAKRLLYIYALIAFAMIGLSTAPVASKTSVKEEIEIGQKAAKEIEKQFPVTENKEWLAEIDRLGMMLSANVNRKELPYSFKILKEKIKDTNQIDAFSLPGGPIYMSERLWRLLSKDERIGVLAHEIMHVDKRHAIDTISEMQRRSIFASALLAIVGAKGGWWDAAGMANQLYTLKYSRKREQEADMGGVNLCLAANVSPIGLVTSLKKIMRLEQESGGSTPRIFATHPPTKDRVDYLTKRVVDLGIKPSDLEPKFTDTGNRIGNVVEKNKKEKVVTISTVRAMTPGEQITIKKPLWNDDANAMTPTAVAKGVVKDAGNRTQVSVTMEPGFEFEDVETGDGIYPVPTPDPPKTQK